MFFFDVVDGRALSRDDTGMEMLSIQAARREAIASLLSIGRERLAPSFQNIAIDVRNARDHVVFAATLSLRITVQEDE